MGGNWRPAGRAKAVAAWVVMFSIIVFGWLIFAAPSLGWLMDLFTSPILGTREQQAVALIGLSTVAVYSIPMIVKMLMDRHAGEDSVLRSFYYAAATAAILVYVNSTTPDFIYFQF